MILNRTIHDGLYRYWNRQMWPYTYADIAKFSHLQNRIYETFCHNSGSIFIDLAALYPLNPHLFLDGVHTTNAGTKLRAWIVFNQLVPILDKKLSSGELPKEARQTLDVHPVLDKEPWQTMALEDILAR